MTTLIVGLVMVAAIMAAVLAIGAL